MAINLKKGGPGINLKKEKPGLKNIKLGLGWDIRDGQECDLDASALMLGANDKLINDESLVFFNNLKSSCGSVVHSGDNRTGAGDGDDEVINVSLEHVPSNVQSILFTISCYPRKDGSHYHFGQVKNASVRVYDASADTVLAEYDLTEDMSGYTSMEMAKMVRDGDDWKFSAVGTTVGKTTIGMEDLLAKYN